MTMNRRAKYQPKHAARSSFVGTHILQYSLKPNWTVVFLTSACVSILAALGIFLWVVIP